MHARTGGVRPRGRQTLHSPLPRLHIASQIDRYQHFFNFTGTRCRVGWEPIKHRQCACSTAQIVEFVGRLLLTKGRCSTGRRAPYLYTPAAQEIESKHFYRPIDKAVFVKYEKQFAKVDLFTVKDLFGDWQQIHKKHLGEGSIFDQVYLKN